MTLVSLFAVIHAPAMGATATVAYDERYVAMNPLVAGGDPGSDSTGDGTMAHPWRTITYAISKLPYTGGNPDRINVGPSDTLWYGGSVPENILINKIDPAGLAIKSLNGAAATTINVDSEHIPPASDWDRSS